MALAYLFWSGWWLKYPSMDEYPKMRRMSLEITILWSLPSFWRTTDRIRVFWRWGDCVKRDHVSRLLLWKAKKRTVTNLKPPDPPPHPPSFRSTPLALPHPRVVTYQHILNQNKLPFYSLSVYHPNLPYPTLLQQTAILTSLLLRFIRISENSALLRMRARFVLLYV